MIAAPTDKTILSAVQPSGTLHIGNYLGAIKQWVALQKNNTNYFCIVDQHAITSDYDPKELPEKVLDTAAIYIAAGIDPEQSAIFIQSHVPAHTELSWLLGSITPFGELQRMTQFKDKTSKQKDATLGLFSYPVLMAADILLYQTDFVPVGNDQVQHIELTRDIAKRFNNKFGDTFVVPEAIINQATARIMSLTNPEQKMSKSDQPKGYVALTDTPEDIRKKIASAVTGTEPLISFEQGSPGVKNLLNILKALRNETEEAIEQEFNNTGFKELKEAVSDTVVNYLEPIQTRYETIRRDDETLTKILTQGATQARETANHSLQQVKIKMGLA